ncbi:Hypothetical predicted protein, partial [Mytilus galloprovincialis]
ESNNYSITSFTTNSSQKLSLPVSSVVQLSVNIDLYHTTRTVAPIKSSILPTALNEKIQSEAARLHILSTTITTTNNLKNPSSYVTHNMNTLESTTTRISDPFINCHSKIGNSISIIQNSTTWKEAFGQCVVQKSKLADIVEIETDRTCNKISKTNNDKFFWTGNFYKLSTKISIEGQISNTTEYNDLKSPIPQDELPYICEREEVKRTFDNETVFTGYFRFGINASVKSDDMDKPAVAFICKVMSCDSDNTYHISVQNCNSITFGYLCVNNNSHETKNSSQTKEPESTSAYATTRKMTSQSNVKQQTSDFLFHSSQDNVDNRSIIITHSTQSSVEGSSQTTRLDSTRSMVNRSSYVSRNATGQISYTTSSKITTQSNFQQRTSAVLSHSSPDNINNVQVVATSPVRTGTTKNSETTWQQKITSYIHSNTTVLKEREMLESTTRVSEIPSGSHSRIGLILGSLVAGVVVIAAVVLLVICRLRHHRLFMKNRFVDDSQIIDSNFPDIDDTSNQSSPHVHKTMNDIHTVSGDDTRFELLDVTHDSSNNIRNNEYAVVVKNNQSGNQVVEHNCDMNGRNSNDLVENEYNGVNHERPRSGNNSSNSRNNEYAVVVKKNQSSNQEVEQNCSTDGENSDDLLESEYDKLNHVRPRSGKGSNNLYDSALGFRDDYDATYNTTDYRRTDKGDDSVYDHT